MARQRRSRPRELADLGESVIAALMDWKTGACCSHPDLDVDITIINRAESVL